jgi:hypothetical protein
MIYEINRSAHKLTQTPMLIIIIKIIPWIKRLKTTGIKV